MALNTKKLIDLVVPMHALVIVAAGSKYITDTPSS